MSQATPPGIDATASGATSRNLVTPPPIPAVALFVSNASTGGVASAPLPPTVRRDPDRGGEELVMPLTLEPERSATEPDRAAGSTRRSPTPMLLRLAGLCALVAGLCYVFVGVFHPANVPGSVTGTRWAIVHVVACAMCFFGLLGLVGLYARQSTRSGWLGLVGFVLLSLWLVLIMGFSFVEAFVLPRLATTDPRFVAAWFGMLIGPATRTDLGALPTLWTLTGPIYIAGGLAFGIATFRARVLPRWAGALLAVGTALAPVATLLPNASQPKIAIPVGVAFVWLGAALALEARPGAEPRVSGT